MCSNAANGVASLNQPSASLYVVSATSGAVLSSFAVGDPIRLTASLLDGRESHVFFYS